MRVLLRFCRPILVVAVALFVTGCGQNPLNQNPPDDSPYSATPPGVQFDWPTGDASLADDATATIRYTVTTNRPVSAKLMLDPDANPANGNEIALANNRQFDNPGGNDAIPFVPGWYPYGSYRLRVALSDASHTYEYALFGDLRIVGGAGSGPDATAGLQDVTGLRLLHFTGAPVAVAQRIPFVDTWHVLDVADNLSPRFVLPISFDREVELHRLQFFVFGRTDVMNKRIEIWQGTDESSPGTLLHRRDASLASFRTGGWNAVTLDPPITLPAGNYGISYHAEYEFSDHWAGNAPQGPGYVWVSAFGGAPFQKVDAAELGFNPNFSLRALGRYTTDVATAQAARIKLPVAGDSAPVKLSPNDKLDFTYGADRAERESPVHVVWRSAE